MRNDKDTYYNYRDRFNGLIKNNNDNTGEAAQLFYYLNHTDYNGLCRFNSSGLFNVPCGKYKNINYKYDFSEYKDIMKDWEFVNKDFSELNLNHNDFLYVDPPYDVEFTKYSKEDFSWDDQVRLIKWLNNLKNPIIISNQATPRIIELYKQYNYKIEFKDVPRFINSDKNKRGNVKEIIGIKNIEWFL